MSTCEDFPACGHESGCCPDFDPETGKQLNMKCTCGATVPLTSRSSICQGCLRSDGDGDYDYGDEEGDDGEYEPDPEQFLLDNDYGSESDIDF